MKTLDPAIEGAKQAVTRAVFLDRDGVINRKPPEGEYVTRWEDLHVLRGAAEAIALLNAAGFLVIVVTNQRCIAKGLITSVELEKLHQQMSDLLRRDGAIVDAIYLCPHEMEPVCRCRKPAPGMLLDAAHAHDIDLAASWMIGDSEIDIAAGKNAGCKTVWLVSGNETVDVGESAGTKPGDADMVAPSLLDAIRKILQRDRDSAGSADSGHHVLSATRSQSF